ncbi:hypothetical protein Phab24_id144 [Acinetobacter phage Phab24]|nr:hypothetical protein Phab24_id144 [Acinetobacter phage Phab24]
MNDYVDDEFVEEVYTVEDEEDLKDLSTYEKAKLARKAVQHRRFFVTLRSKQIYRSFRKTIKKDLDDFTEAEILTIYRVVADALNMKNPELNLYAYKHIRARVERAYNDKRKSLNKSG